MATTVSAPVSLGRFVWLELLTADPKAAIAFYTKVVGWTATPFDGPTPYTMWTTPRGPIGGVLGHGPELKARGVPPHWVAYVSTPDCAATLAQVTKLGGRVYVEATEIPTVGRFGVFSDPQGAVLALLSPAQGDAPVPEGTPGAGEVVWHELATTDHRAAFDFYHTLFGWEKTSAMEMGPDNLYQMYGRTGQSYGGMYNLDPKVQPHPAWLHYVEVTDVDAAGGRITQSGGKVVNGPMDVPGGRVLMAVDPEGVPFALHRIKAQ